MSEKLCKEKADIIEKAVNDAQDVNYGQDGLGRLAAVSETLFGSCLKESLWHQDKSLIKRLFQYLMDLEVPPTEVWVGKNSLDLIWYPIGKVILEKDEYICLLKKFQKFIDSIGELDLVINFDAMDTCHNGDSSVITSPTLRFIKEYFKNTEIASEIRFVDYTEYNCEYFLSYDSEGNVRYNQEII